MDPLNLEKFQTPLLQKDRRTWEKSELLPHLYIGCGTQISNSWSTWKMIFIYCSWRRKFIRWSISSLVCQQLFLSSFMLLLNFIIFNWEWQSLSSKSEIEVRGPVFRWAVMLDVCWRSVETRGRVFETSMDWTSFLLAYRPITRGVE